MMDEAAREEYQREYQRKLDALSEHTYLDVFFRCPRCGGNVRVVTQDGFPQPHPYYQCARLDGCPHDTLYSVRRYDTAVFKVLFHLHENQHTMDALIQAWIQDQNQRNGEDPVQHREERDALLRPRTSYSASIGAEIAGDIGGFLGGWEHDISRIDPRTRKLEQQECLREIVDHIQFKPHGICLYFRHLDIPIEVIVEPMKEGQPVFFPALDGDIEVRLFLFHDERQKGVTKTLDVFGTKLTIDLPPNREYRQKLRLRNAATLLGESEPLRNVIVHL